MSFNNDHTFIFKVDRSICELSLKLWNGLEHFQIQLPLQYIASETSYSSEFSIKLIL